MDNLFIGYAVDRELSLKLPAVSAAGNNFQLGFIEAWKKRDNLKVASVIPMGTWPATPKILVSKKRVEYRMKSGYKIIPYFNIKILKELTIAISIAKYIKKICKGKNGREVNIITYNGNGPLSLPVLWLRKRYHYQYICLVVDPPLYQGTTIRTSAIWKLLYKSLKSSFMRAVAQCDVCVVLNKYFAEEYLHRKDYYVLDCGVDIGDLYQYEQETEEVCFWKKDDNLHLVFTGILHEHSGILRFIDMFQKLRIPGMVLHVFGKGIYEKQIEQIAANDPIVEYHGFIKNSMIRTIQKQADLLVCPNTIEHPINKVAFPSKIQEYMLSGVPVLATTVNGLGTEYYDYIYPYNDTLTDLSRVLSEILADGVEKRLQKAKLAREFIVKEKNWDAQIDKFLKHLEKKGNEN